MTNTIKLFKPCEKCKLMGTAGHINSSGEPSYNIYMCHNHNHLWGKQGVDTDNPFRPFIWNYIGTHTSGRCYRTTVDIFINSYILSDGLKEIMNVIQRMQ